MFPEKMCASTFACKYHVKIHRGRTSRTVFRFISRDFIHIELEALTRIYIIAVDCKCILIFPT